MARQHSSPTLFAPLSRRVLLGGTGLSALALAGCGGEKSTGPSSNGGSGGKVVDTVRYACTGTPSSAALDPHGLLPSEADLVRMAQVYDVLTVFDGEMAPQPRLAESWTPNDEATEWTVKIRDDAVFSDGRPVTAKDVLWSLQRMEDKSAENYFRLSMFSIKNSKVIDDYTLLIKTANGPYADFATAVCAWSFVVPDGENDFAKGDVPGSGPFTVKSSDASVTVLERNDDWWGPAPPTKTIELRFVPDPQARANSVLGGQADWAAAVTFPMAQQNEDNPKVQTIEVPGANLYPLVMRADTAPFDNPDVIEAVKLGLDREALVEKVFLGFGVPGNDLLTPFDVNAPDRPATERDVSAAKALIDGAGAAAKEEVKLFTSNIYPGMDSAATLIAQQLGEIGMNVTVEQHPADTYWTQVWGREPFYLSYAGGVPFVDWMRGLMSPESPTNDIAWDDPQWTEDATLALADTDDASRKELLGDLQATLADEGGYCIWAAGSRVDLAVPGLSGFPQGIGVAVAFIDQIKLTA